MGVHRPWVFTGHGCSQAMGVHRPWVFTGHGCSPAMGVHRLWVFIGYGCSMNTLIMLSSYTHTHTHTHTHTTHTTHTHTPHTHTTHTHTTHTHTTHTHTPHTHTPHTLQGWVMKTGGGIKQSTFCLTFRQDTFFLNACMRNNNAQAFELLSNGLVWHKASDSCLAPSISKSQLRLVECSGETEEEPLTDLVWKFTVVSVT